MLSYGLGQWQLRFIYHFNMLFSWKNRSSVLLSIGEIIVLPDMLFCGLAIASIPKLFA
jgi:hypothetical protein